MKVFNLVTRTSYAVSETQEPRLGLPKSNSLKLVLFSALILFITCATNWSAIYANLPYFYNEDEAHHFNRVVDMVKTGDYNPHYFLKPSLHFYLRMPVVAASFLWSVRKGQILSVKDIRTRDSNGLSGYSLTASHPGIVKWQRMFSLAMIIVGILLSALMLYQASSSYVTFILTGLILALSPAFPLYGTSVGVDAPMFMFCVLTTFFSYAFYNTKATSQLFLACIFAGLAISTKYNALPILLTPLIALIISKQVSLLHLTLCLLLPIVAFFMGSPYILVSLPEFLDHFAYEIWHYGVAVHQGHTATPGIQQAWLYSKWLATFALSPLTLLLGLSGAWLFCKSNLKAALIFLIFPVTYFLLMIMQRTHFERNMLVVLPALAMMCALTCTVLINKLQRYNYKSAIYIFIGALLFTWPLYNSLQLKFSHAATIDSRQLAHAWLTSKIPSLTSTAISGKLQLPLFQHTHHGKIEKTVQGIKRLSPEDFDFFNLYLNGYDRVVVGPEVAVHEIYQFGFKPIRKFVGSREIQRVINNPEVRVYAADTSLIPQILLTNKKNIDNIPEFSLQCEQFAEGQCWTNTRMLKLPDKAHSLTFSAFSPWPNQKIAVFSNGKPSGQVIKLSSKWSDYTLNLAASENILMIDRTLSPVDHGLSADTRRLGFAYKKVKLN